MRSTVFVQMVNKVMSAAVNEYADKVDRMIRLEAAKSGNLERAIEKLCRDFGFTPAQLKHLRGGRAKDPKLSLVRRVRIAYLEYCERMVLTLQHDIEVERAKHEDADLEHLLADASALAEKVRKAKQARL